jgi:dipeptidyl aminopeptidase/acylaminoacyl peptidase
LRPLVLILLSLVLLAACAAPPPAPTPTITPRPATRTPAPTVTPYPTPTRAPTWTPEPSATSALQAFSQYGILALRQRTYGGGELTVTQKVDENRSYSRYLIRYPSDGLTIYGYADIPRGAGPFPVIVMLHGHSDEAGYSILQDTGYAEMYAVDGYIVLHPNFRNYQPSDRGDNRFMVGMAVDVLNLLALVKQKAGQEGLLQYANPEKIGLWALSMGGAIALKVLTISPDVKAAFLYSPMGGDDYQNAQFLASVGDPEAQAVVNLPPLVYQGISPQYFYQDLTAAVDIHHGLSDSVIPVGWSQRTCEQLKTLGKTINCYFYPGEDHIFTGNSGVKLKLRMSNFFYSHLKAPPKTPTPAPTP